MGVLLLVLGCRSELPATDRPGELGDDELVTDTAAPREPEEGHAPAEPVDADGDGVLAEDDCDDQDASVWEDGGTLEADLRDAESVSAFCVGACTRALDGSVYLPKVELEADDLSELSCLTSVSEGIYLYRAPGLTSLDGLAQLERVGELWLSGGAYEQLDALDGLVVDEGIWVAQLEHVERLPRLEVAELDELVLSELPVLADITGLSGLTSVDALTLEDLDALVSVEGLETLAEASYVRLHDLSSLASLQGLRSLEEVDGDMTLGALPALVDLSGLEALATVSEELTVANVDGLTSLAGLDGLVAVETLDLDDNDSLQSLAGLGALRTVDSVLHVTDHDSLESLAGLALTDPGGGLHIARNEVLGSLHGLEDLRWASNLQLRDLPALVDLSALGGLEGLDGSLQIEEVGTTTFHGLESVRETGLLYLVDNPNLADVTALHGLESVDDDLYIVDNPSLSAADAQALVDAIDHIRGVRTVRDNGE